MLILLLTYALAQSVYSEAGPIPVSIELRDVASCDGLNSQRSIWSIVWSCLCTIFLCTWVAVHPNVHFRPEKPNQNWHENWLWDPLHEFFTHNLVLFLWALLVPEYILAWAVRQYVQAGIISKRVPEWTRTHGFFLIMGGFHLFRLPANTPCIPLPLESSKLSGFVVPIGRHLRRDDIPVCPLKFEDFPINTLEIISPTEAELRDKSKSDALTKIIVLAQTLWFVIQCIARGTQRLPLTELEVVTLAYAMVNFFIYVFWWDKPQNVGCPIRVYKTLTATSKESGDEPVTKELNHYSRLYEPVPMVWTGRIADIGEAGLGPSILGSAFGAIHCIAWSSEFPSRAEIILWRISCVAMIAVPFMVAFVCAHWATGKRSKTEGNYIDLLGYIAKLCIVLLVPSALLYIAGRVATLVIAFSSLRSLPPAAFVTVEWTTFIPHI